MENGGTLVCKAGTSNYNHYRGHCIEDSRIGNGNGGPSVLRGNGCRLGFTRCGRVSVRILHRRQFDGIIERNNRYREADGPIDNRGSYGRATARAGLL